MACFLELSSFITLGRNLIRFNSNPNQTRGQEMEERTKREPVITPIIITTRKFLFRKKDT